MAPLSVDDETLGIKHKQFNQLVKGAIASKKNLDDKAFSEDKNDLNNLTKIHIASHNKDIDYIFSVLKSEDMLYVSRAIKQSPWLVDDQYAHIINPQYLNDHLFPYMKTKASLKLLKHIRHYLKTESRVEQFYKNETFPKSAAKWLSRCSILFIEVNISKHMQHITCLQFKRLCERSITIFEAAMKDSSDKEKIQAGSFLLHTHADKYLDVFDNAHRYGRPKFGPAATELIMKKTPDRIINNFLMYIEYIHVPTFVKYIKKEEIKDFLFNLANKEVKGLYEHRYRTIFQFKITKEFVKRMPKEEQFEFVKKVFLDKENIMKVPDESLERGTEMFAIKQICVTLCSSTPLYYWYEFAPFNTAFEDIKKLIQSETNINEKYSMLNILLNCAGKNTKDLLSLLMYYFKNNLNDNIVQKKRFINKLLSRTEIYKNDDVNWNAFIEIFENLNVYTENDDQEYVELVIINHVLQNKQVSEMIEKKFSFNTLKNYRKKLNQDEENKLFEYLYNYTVKEIESHTIQNENDFNEAIRILHQLLDLLLDWDKQLVDYPLALNKIKNLARMSKDKSWKINLSPLYNKKKSWRRFMFEESVILNPTQDVCVNALKNDPGLLVRYKNDVEAICCDDKISLKQLLRKVRIYWPESLADSWTQSYFDRLDNLGGQKALTCGLFTLLPQQPLLDFIKKYAPAQSKIDWNNTNELTLGLQRYIAKNMHIARPQPPADAILLYAKGDFLQYALPSLLAIYYNMPCVQSQEHIPKLLNSPVSLQKHGLRLAFTKLKHEELKYHLSNIWKTSKNISIRAVSFVLLFDLMCKEKDAVKAEELWDILEVFMDNLSFKEDKKIYEKLPMVEAVPEKIKPQFLIKSYIFLKNLLPHVKDDRRIYEYYIEKLADYTREVMEFICPEFVFELITEYLNDNFFNTEVQNLNDGKVRVMSSYLLCAKDEETQSEKYEKIITPLLKRALEQWNETQKENYFIRQRFQQLLSRFARDLNEFVFTNKMIIPTKMFSNIQNQLNKSLVVPQNYLMLTMWKLIVKMTKLIEKNDNREDWLQVCSEMAPEYGKYCLEVLKEDVKLYFPCIYILYAKVLKMTIHEFLPDIVRLQIYECMLSDQDFIQAFLVTLKIFSDRYYLYRDDEYTKKENEIRKIIRNHPTVEVKMHYHCTFDGEDDTEVLDI